MKKDTTYKLFLRLLFSGIILFLILLMQPLEVYTFFSKIDVLFPSGWVGLMQRDLLLFIQVAMLIFIIPVYILTFAFSWRYRADNTKAKYDPHLVDHKVAEFFWWGIPLIFTVVVAVITGIRTFELDPYKPLKSDQKPQQIKVVALQWRWLFIYPEEQIATINYLRIPTGRPIHFTITADAPMNSLWIPKLGGQIYAMPGMETQLHLIANEAGSFRGSSANISGEGFAKMHFVTDATDDAEYERWVSEVQASDKLLDWEEYETLAAPSLESDVQYFKLGSDTLFKEVVMQFMKPPNDERHSQNDLGSFPPLFPPRAVLALTNHKWLMATSVISETKKYSETLPFAPFMIQKLEISQRDFIQATAKRNSWITNGIDYFGSTS